MKDMQDIKKIDLIPEEDKTVEIPANKAVSEVIAPKKLSHKVIKYAVCFIIFIFTATAVFSSWMIMPEQNSISWLNNIPGLKQVKYLAESADRKLKGEDQDRVNILLLGIGGENHAGGNLTDTIMLVSLQPSTKKVSMVSIPRDLAVPIENRGWRKINSINAFAEQDNTGSGGLAVCQGISKILDIPIDYYIRVDFQAFINIVDELGGVDVEVENTLDDYSYPVLGNEDAAWSTRYEHLHVEKGMQHMDGSLALKFARSRHAAGVEGSDFARAKRQQNIITAVKDKAMSTSVIFKPTMISNIIGELKNHISTNLQIWEMVKLWNQYKDIGKTDIINKVIDNGASGLLVSSISDEGAYILQPRSGDFAEIQYLVKTIFQPETEDWAATVKNEKATIEVRNGTWVNGLASKISLDMEKIGFNVVRIGNNSKQQYETSIIYDLSYGAKPKSLDILKQKTGANVAYTLPDWLKTEIKEDVVNEKDPIQPDFILILGQNADKSQSGTANTND